MADGENPYERFKAQDLMLRDELALDRTVLANERTFLSYIRMSVGFAVVGGTLLKFAETSAWSALGIVFLALGAATLWLGIWRTVKMQRRITSCRRLAERQ